MEFRTVLAILGELYISPPTRESLGRSRRALDGERHDAVEPLRHFIAQAEELDDSGLNELQTEFARLFVGPQALPCPPWESVYTSPNRQMMQDAFDSLRDLYGSAGVMVRESSVQPDHIGAELQFLALLLERIAVGSSDECGPLEVLADRLLDEHLNRWVGPFTRDVERAASLPLYKAVAMTTKDVITLIQE